MKKIDVLIAPQTKEFVKLCNQYIKYLDSMPDKKLSDFWVAQLRMLSGIYTNVFLLPEIDVRYEGDVEKFVTEKEYNKLYKKLSDYIGALDTFPDFSDLSHPGSLKVINASLAEMLTDIYQELKDFVKLYETSSLENMNDAIAECYETFGQYWGAKLLTALRIIHINQYKHRYAEAKKAQQIEVNINEMIDEADFDSE